MNLHFELDGMDWSGTSARAAKPNLDLYGDEDQHEHADVVDVAYEVLGDLETETYAVLWYARPSYDLLLIPESNPEGLFTIALLKDGELEKSEEMASQLTALRAVIDFCVIDHVPVEVVITDRRLVPFELEALEDDEFVEGRRSWALADYESPDFIWRSEAVFTSQFYHRKYHQEQFESLTRKDVAQRLLDHEYIGTPSELKPTV